MPNNLGGSSGSGGSGSGSGSGSGAGGSSKGSSGNTNPSGSSTGPGGSSNVSASLGPNGQVVITTTNNQTGQVSYATQPVGGGSVVNYGSTNPSSPGAVAITQTQANLAQQVGGGKSVSGAISPTASLFSVNGALNPLGFTTTSKTSASSASPLFSTGLFGFPGFGFAPQGTYQIPGLPASQQPGATKTVATGGGSTVSAPVDYQTFGTNAQITFPDPHGSNFTVTESLPGGTSFSYSGSVAGVGLGTVQATNQAVDQAWSAYQQGGISTLPGGSKVSVTQSTEGLNLNILPPGLNAAQGTTYQTFTLAPGFTQSLPNAIQNNGLTQTGTWTQSSTGFSFVPISTSFSNGASSVTVSSTDPNALAQLESYGFSSEQATQIMNSGQSVTLSLQKVPNFPSATNLFPTSLFSFQIVATPNAAPATYSVGPATNPYANVPLANGYEYVTQPSAQNQTAGNSSTQSAAPLQSIDLQLAQLLSQGLSNQQTTQAVSQANSTNQSTVQQGQVASSWNGLLPAIEGLAYSSVKPYINMEDQLYKVTEPYRIGLGQYYNQTVVGPQAQASQLQTEQNYRNQGYLGNILASTYAVPLAINNALAVLENKYYSLFGQTPTGGFQYTAGGELVQQNVQNEAPTIQAAVQKLPAGVIRDAVNFAVATPIEAFSSAVADLSNPNVSSSQLAIDYIYLATSGLAAGEANLFGLGSTAIGGGLSKVTGNPFFSNAVSNYQFGAATTLPFEGASVLGDVLAGIQKDATGAVIANTGLRGVPGFLVRSSPVSALFGGLSAGQSYLQGNTNPVSLAENFGTGYLAGTALAGLGAGAKVGADLIGKTAYRFFGSIGDFLGKMASGAEPYTEKAVNIVYDVATGKPVGFVTSSAGTTVMSDEELLANLKEAYYRGLVQRPLPAEILQNIQDAYARLIGQERTYKPFLPVPRELSASEQAVLAAPDSSPEALGKLINDRIASIMKALNINVSPEDREAIYNRVYPQLKAEVDAWLNAEKNLPNAGAMSDTARYYNGLVKARFQAVLDEITADLDAVAKGKRSAAIYQLPPPKLTPSEAAVLNAPDTSEAGWIKLLQDKMRQLDINVGPADREEIYSNLVDQFNAWKAEEANLPNGAAMKDLALYYSNLRETYFKDLIDQIKRNAGTGKPFIAPSPILSASEQAMLKAPDVSAQGLQNLLRSKGLQLSAEQFQDFYNQLQAWNAAEANLPNGAAMKDLSGYYDNLRNAYFKKLQEEVANQANGINSKTGLPYKPITTPTPQLSATEQALLKAPDISPQGLQNLLRSKGLQLSAEDFQAFYNQIKAFNDAEANIPNGNAMADVAKYYDNLRNTYFKAVVDEIERQKTAINTKTGKPYLPFTAPAPELTAEQQALLSWKNALTNRGLVSGENFPVPVGEPVTTESVYRPNFQLINRPYLSGQPLPVLRTPNNIMNEADAERLAFLRQYLTDLFSRFGTATPTPTEIQNVPTPPSNPGPQGNYRVTPGGTIVVEPTQTIPGEPLIPEEQTKYPPARVRYYGYEEPPPRASIYPEPIMAPLVEEELPINVPGVLLPQPKTLQAITPKAIHQLTLPPKYATPTAITTYVKQEPITTTRLKFGTPQVTVQTTPTIQQTTQVQKLATALEEIQQQELKQIQKEKDKDLLLLYPPNRYYTKFAGKPTTAYEQYRSIYSPSLLPLILPNTETLAEKSYSPLTAAAGLRPIKVPEGVNVPSYTSASPGSALFPEMTSTQQAINQALGFNSQIGFNPSTQIIQDPTGMVTQQSINQQEALQAPPGTSPFLNGSLNQLSAAVNALTANQKANTNTSNAAMESLALGKAGAATAPALNTVALTNFNSSSGQYPIGSTMLPSGAALASAIGYQPLLALLNQVDPHFSTNNIQTMSTAQLMNAIDNLGYNDIVVIMNLLNVNQRAAALMDAGYADTYGQALSEAQGYSGIGLPGIAAPFKKKHLEPITNTKAKVMV